MKTDQPPPSFSLFTYLKKVDTALYQLEQRIVTLAALIMTATVCLDILFRALQNQKTEPMQSVLNGFGLISTSHNVSVDQVSIVLIFMHFVSDLILI